MLDLLPPSVLVLALAFYARHKQGNWLAPAAMFPAVWSLHIVLSLVKPQFFPSPGTLWWILLSLLAFYVGSALFQSRTSSAPSHPTFPRSIVFRHATDVLLVCTALGGLYTTLAQLSGIEISVDNLPLAYQFLLPFHFAGPMLGGMISASRSLRGWRRWLVYLPLLPPAGLSILFTGRTAIVAPILAWLAGYWAIKLFITTGRWRVLTWRNAFVGAGIFVSFLLLGVGLYQLRGARQSGETFTEKLIAFQDAALLEGLAETWDRFSPGVYGNVYSFDYYFVEAWQQAPALSWGAVMFTGPLNLLGIIEDRYPFPQFELEPGHFSNSYTMFRLPIDDFGFAGSLVWWCALGCLQGWAYRQMLQGRSMACLLLAWFYVDASLMGGYFFRYNSIVLNYVIVGALMSWMIFEPGVMRRRRPWFRLGSDLGPQGAQA